FFTFHNMSDEITDNDILTAVDNGVPDPDDLNVSNQTDEMEDP
ncbi:hypothetical protein NPIL_614491, partial [Nephila pilipes]